jgi:Fe-S cluster assembly ATPase SufC
MAYEIEGFDFDNHIDKLIDIAKSVKKEDITILTGPNGYGKSFLRKIMGQLNGKYEFPKVASVSMESRTTAKENFSAFRSLAMDKDWDATSNHTCYMIESLLRTDDRYFVIDEPEIGMGKEMLLGLIEELNEKIEIMKSEGKFLGIMFITHSEFFIDHLKYDTFINLDGLTYEQWKNREIKAIGTKKLSDWSHHMWRAIEKRLH